MGHLRGKLHHSLGDLAAVGDGDQDPGGGGRRGDVAEADGGNGGDGPVHRSGNAGEAKRRLRSTTEASVVMPGIMACLAYLAKCLAMQSLMS